MFAAGLYGHLVYHLKYSIFEDFKVTGREVPTINGSHFRDLELVERFEHSLPVHVVTGSNSAGVHGTEQFEVHFTKKNYRTRPYMLHSSFRTLMTIQSTVGFQLHNLDNIMLFHINCCLRRTSRTFIIKINKCIVSAIDTNTPQNPSRVHKFKRKSTFFTNYSSV